MARGEFFRSVLGVYMHRLTSEIQRQEYPSPTTLTPGAAQATTTTTFALIRSCSSRYTYSIHLH